LDGIGDNSAYPPLGSICQVRLIQNNVRCPCKIKSMI